MSRKRKIHSGETVRKEIISSLESKDRYAAKLRRVQISNDELPKSSAAKSEIEIHSQLIESRLLIQRAFTTISNVGENIDLPNTEIITSRLNDLFSSLVGTRRTLCSHMFENNSNPEAQLDQEGDEISRLDKEYSTLKESWKSTFNKHHAKVHLQNQSDQKKFKVIQQSFWTQVQNTARQSSMLGNSNDQNNNYDDSKLYHQMLQEYITSSSEKGKANINIATSARLKRSLSKKITKKDIDRRASKGRKIRYIVHEKLTNFTFPTKRDESILDEDVLFRSMFGGAVHQD